MKHNGFVACRMFGILARRAPLAVLLRRGPTRRVQLIRWDTARDRFEPGHWLHGRIYERRCDLSPDGKLFAYFAAKHVGIGSWTAISRPPWLTALALWPKGDCWFGGGLFESDGSLWLNHRPQEPAPDPAPPPRKLRWVPNPWACGEDAPIYWKRLARDGWQLRQQGSYDMRNWNHGPRTIAPEIWTRQGPGGWRLVMTNIGIDFSAIGVYKLVFTLEHGKKELLVEGDAWADWDQRGRLVYTREGKVLAGAVRGGQLVETELADFGAARSENRPPPAEATRW